MATDIPSCVNYIIETNRDNQNWFVGNVEEYRFQNKLVYAFKPDEKLIADASTLVISQGCNTLCTVGCIGGPDITLCNGGNFNQRAVFARKCWNKY